MSHIYIYNCFVVLNLQPLRVTAAAVFCLSAAAQRVQLNSAAQTKKAGKWR